MTDPGNTPGDPLLRPIEADAELSRELAGQRLDASLAQVWPQHSRSQLQRWLESGAISVDGAPARGRVRVRGGERVSLRATEQIQAPDQPEAIPLDFLFEDPAVLVLSKPAGLVVHPGAGNRSGTLVNALLAFDPMLARLPRAGIVHRLDKETSGALLIARTAEAHQILVRALAAREIEREYLALVQGEPVSGVTVDAPLDRHPGDRLRRAVVHDGRPAVTHARIEKRYNGYTLLRCKLETGRTHQIRVHLAHMRLPIVGDPLYGGRLRLPAGASPELIEQLRGFRRQALHAIRLAFAHPLSGERIETHAPMPADFSELLQALG
jgi:23S rRNA pseudouridine1911/1915/1917 synthase